MAYAIYCADSLLWLSDQSEHSFHAVVTDPPFGLLEFSAHHLAKKRTGKGGVWRIPPSFGNCERSPLPRFTVLSDEDIKRLHSFFHHWAQITYRVLVPGAHVLIAANPLLSHVVFSAVAEGGFEKRGEIVRLVRTLRGGDRPKGAEEQYRDLSTMPRSCWQPWGLFRKPLDGTVNENLRCWKTGALRRPSPHTPFCDLIESGRTPASEREIAPHPSLKPQAFMRKIVWSVLPVGEGVVLDPFMGGGATIAAAEAVGYDSVGIEIDEEYYLVAKRAIPRLANLKTHAAASEHREHQPHLPDLQSRPL